MDLDPANLVLNLGPNSPGKKNSKLVNPLKIGLFPLQMAFSMVFKSGLLTTPTTYYLGCSSKHTTILSILKQHSGGPSMLRNWGTVRFKAASSNLGSSRMGSLENDAFLLETLLSVAKC